MARRVGLVVAASVAVVLLAAAPAGAAVAVSPVAVDFGPVPVGTTATAVVTVSNTGNTPFGPIQMFGGAPPSAEFDASQSCQGNTLPVGGSCTISVRFTPGAPGTFADASRFTISDTSNQSDGQDFEVALRGTGVDPNATTTSSPATTTTAPPTPTTAAGGSTPETMPSTPPPPNVLAVTFGFAIVDVGGEQTATVTGFQAGESVSASLRPGDVDLGAQTADGSGVVRIAFPIADDADPGLHELVVTGASGQASGTFEVAGAQEVLQVSAGEDGSGGGTNWWLVAGLVVAVAGAVGIGSYLVGSRSPEPTPEP